MSKKHNHIDYLSPELFKAYRQGDLSQEEAHAVERYLEENPFEAAALEGLEAMPNDALESHLDDLNARVDARTGEEKETKTIFWTLRRVAAGLVLLASASALYFWNDQPIPTRELTQDVKKEKEDANEIVLGNRQASTDSVVSADEIQKPASESDDNFKETEQDKALQGRVAGVEVVKSDSAQDTFSPKNDGLVMASDMAASPAPKVIQLAPVEVISRQALAKKAIERDETEPANKTELKQAKFQATLKKREQESLSVESESTARIAQVKRKSLALPDSLRFVAPSITSGFVQNKRSLPIIQSNSLNSTISGQVTGKDGGLPLPQVTVLIPGTTIGTPTDADGRFTINADTTIHSLLFRYLGYTTQTVDVKGKNIVNVSLEPDDQSVGEVVMVAEGRAKRRDLAVAEFTSPAPVGSQKSFKQYIKDNLRYPEAARAQRVRGRVTLEFDLSATGLISNIRVIKGLGSGCDEEAIRLLKEGPAWEPKRNKLTGEAVDSKVQVKIRFKP